MKKLEIIMSIKATNINEAESIAKRELMDLARVIARNNGSSMTMGEGNATETSYGYRIKASVTVDGNGNVNEIVNYAQCLWMDKPEILKSAIFVSEEEKAKYTCKVCGCAMETPEIVVNEGMKNEYCMCEDCFDNGNDEIQWCCTCGSYVDGLIENPVTRNKCICPHCGDMI